MDVARKTARNQIGWIVVQLVIIKVIHMESNPWIVGLPLNWPTTVMTRMNTRADFVVEHHAVHVESPIATRQWMTLLPSEQLVPH